MIYNTIYILGITGKGLYLMSRRFVKPLTVVLALAVMMPAFTACGSKNGKTGKRERKISSDMPWYEVEVAAPDLGLDKSRETATYYPSMIGMDDKYVFVYTSGRYKDSSEKSDGQDFSSQGNEISVVAVIDRESKETVRTIDMMTVHPDGDAVYSAYYSDGMIIGSASSWNDVTLKVKNTEVVIDPETGEVKEVRKAGGGMPDVGKLVFEDYEINTKSNWDGEYGYITLEIISPDGDKKTVELKEPDMNIVEATAVFSLGGDRVMIPGITDNGAVFYEVDLATGVTARGKEEDYSWINVSNLYHVFNSPDGEVYFNSALGVSKIDLSRETTEELLNFSWCNVDRNILINLDLVDVKDNTFQFYGNCYRSGLYGTIDGMLYADFMMVTFTKAGTNPHTGKTILELYARGGYMDQAIVNRINKFNETNGEYYIEITDRYPSDSNFTYAGVNSDDEASEKELNYFSDIGNKLNMDIINGEGPDMFLNISDYSALENDDCLADLSSYAGQLDPEGYFTNIIDLAKVDGKLYNLPISFGITGIFTDRKYAGKTGVGFTTEEYEKFVKETLNGKDVITSGQAYYFAQLFECMKDKFIVNGKADLTAPEFKIIADYVKNNVPEKSMTRDEIVEGEEYFTGSDIEESSYAINDTCDTYFDYMINVKDLNGASAILGLPSADGRGPVVSPKITIAVSAHAYDLDACGEFIKQLLSDEAQEELAAGGDLVLNRKAFRNVGLEAVDYFNSILLPQRYDSTYLTDNRELKNKITFTSGHLDDLENCILICSEMSSSDTDITKILVEEMPAYFSGQKDLDSVVMIMQDRVQKVLDERG